MDNWGPLVARFSALFDGLKRAYGQYSGEQKTNTGKLKGKARTYSQPLTSKEWQSHLAGETRLGVVPVRDDATVVFGAIDIDDYSITPEQMEARAASLGLPLVTTRSKSGGSHLWLFLREAQSAAYIRDLLHQWAVALGYPAAEVFPKQDALASEADVGNWIHVPYQHAWNTTTYGLLNGKQLDPEQWLTYAEASRLSSPDLASVEINEVVGLEGAPPCLQALARHGVPEGNRNNALFAFAVLAKMRSDDNWEDDLDKLNHTYMHPPLPRTELSVIIKSLQKKEYFYPCKQNPIKSVCNKELCREAKYGIAGQDDDPGVQVSGITKVLTDPPHYFVQVNGKRIEVPSSEILLQQARFQRVVFEAVDIIPKSLKSVKWVSLINRLMKDATYVEAPDDAGTYGQFQFHLQQFCTVRAQANDQSEMLHGKAWTDDSGWTWFRGSDLLAYLERQHFRQYRVHQIWAMLREKVSAKHQFVNLKGVGANVWGIPKFTDVQQEEFDVPRTESDDVF